jgi:pimeloyl-ACP methyl ester carboxylesterase
MSNASPQKTFLVCHGAWGGGWSWKKMHPLMQAAGHRLLTPTYTGLGERAHLANPAIDLESHIQDILNVISYEDLGDIVLLGHSYGGMVATGVADRAREKIAQLIYLDAFVPRDGQSLFDLNEPGRAPMREAAGSGDGWRVPPNPTPPDTPEADLVWLSHRTGGADGVVGESRGGISRRWRGVRRVAPNPSFFARRVSSRESTSRKKRFREHISRPVSRVL